MSDFNATRAKALTAFRRVLDAYRGKPHITETQFRDAWLGELQADPDLFNSGWYDPPPYGMAVLFASEENPDRLSYNSLRHEDAWPGATKADWNGFLFAYASPVNRRTGEIGDFDVTLYFGRDPRLRAHYRACFDATARLLDSVTINDTAHSLVAKTEHVCREHGLLNCVVSVSHETLADVGMTFPVLSEDALKDAPPHLTQTHRDYLRGARKFVNMDENWPLMEGQTVSIEPQLRSATDPSLPQISFHYLAQVKDGQIDICRDIDALIAPLL